MEKVPAKLWAYSIGFLIRAIYFNVAFAFAITALVYVKNGYTVWAVLATIFVSLWLIQNISNHLMWRKLSKDQKALYFGIRRYGKNVVQVTQDEINRRTGQQDLLEILRDTDASLEIQMLINGTATLVNVFIGIKWIYWAKLFNNNSDIFKFEVVKKEK